MRITITIPEDTDIDTNVFPDSLKEWVHDWTVDADEVTIKVEPDVSE